MQHGRGWKWKALLEEVLKWSVDIFLHISRSSLLKNSPFLIIPWIYSSFPKFFHMISERWLHVPVFCSQQDAGLPLHWASFCIPHNSPVLEHSLFNIYAWVCVGFTINIPAEVYWEIRWFKKRRIKVSFHENKSCETTSVTFKWAGVLLGRWILWNYTVKRQRGVSLLASGH